MPSDSRARFKIFSDPVHGFISVPKHLILDLVQTPEVQRLRRIRQLGVGHLVFPGAEHTRFVHALGAMALMHDALQSITQKGAEVSQAEYTAALAAALLHDIGHGPYSHTLEHEFISDFNHEAMSRVLLVHLNDRLDGALDLAIQIFDDTYPRPFFHQLVSSQMDMDRLDYLRRDSFYTGVAEGEVGVQRLIKTMRATSDDQMVIEEKGIYAVENFLISRRLMYWQVYLHKTVLAGDQLLRGVCRRARWLLEKGASLGDGCSKAFTFFLRERITADMLARTDVRKAYCALDDTDVLFTLKRWMDHHDPVLADLSRRFINRDFFRVTFQPQAPTAEQLDRWRRQVGSWLIDQGISTPATANTDARFYLTTDDSSHSAYERVDNAIGILSRNGEIRELTEVSDSAMPSLTHFVVKPYVCSPKGVPLSEL